MASCKYNPNINSTNPYAVLNVTQQSQNISGNYSVVRWELLVYRPSAIYSSATKSFSITVNGSTVKSGTTTIGGSGTKSIASGTTTIYHNSDGTKSISFSFSLQFDITWSGRKIGTGSASGSMALSRIPRATTPSLSPSSVTLGNNITVNLPRASASFTHTLQHDFYAGTWTTFATGAATSATLATSISWAERIPNAVSGGGRIRCLTYNGGTLIGEKVVNFTATVPTSVVPTISAIDVAESADGIAEKFKAFVKTKSQLSVSISAAGAYKSTIKSYSTKIDGKTYTGKTFNSELIGTSGEITVSVTVTDTRGRTATKTTKINVLDYVSPTITTFSAVRGDSNGTPNEEGTFALIKLNFSISPVNNLNDKEYKIEYKRHKDTAWTLLGTGNEYEVKTVLNGGNILNADYSYQMRLTVSDFFSKIETEIDDISSAFTLFDVNKGGKSIAFGGVSERDPDIKAIDFKMEVFDLFGTRINNGMAQYTGSGENAIDANTTTEELVLTNLNTPKSNMMYVKTVFFKEKTNDAKRTQIAIPYSNDNSMYHRCFSDGSWSSWQKHIDDNDFLVQKKLWSGGYHMNNLQTINLSEPLSSQKHGIVLCWSGYDLNAQKVLNTDWWYTFVPKSHLLGAGVSCTNTGHWNALSKYVYITDTQIKGHEFNGKQRTVNGISFANDKSVLRYVVGI